jgi:hypothetical protein
LLQRFELIQNRLTEGIACLYSFDKCLPIVHQAGGIVCLRLRLPQLLNFVVQPFGNAGISSV